MPAPADLGKFIGLGLQYGPRVIGLVKGVKGLFGGSKTGAEKKAFVREAIVEGEDIVEGIANKDLFNGVAAQTLLDEGIETAYQIMKLQERLEAIKAQLALLRPAPPV